MSKRSVTNCGRACECHPLEHAIAQALDAFDNGRPIVTTGAIMRQLRQDLYDWEAEQEEAREERARQRAIGEREQASADGEIWPEACGECGHEPHEGVCKEWVVNHTFGTGGLDKRCQCQRGDYET